MQGLYQGKGYSSPTLLASMITTKIGLYWPLGTSSNKEAQIMLTPFCDYNESEDDEEESRVVQVHEKRPGEAQSSKRSI